MTERPAVFDVQLRETRKSRLVMLVAAVSLGLYLQYQIDNNRRSAFVAPPKIDMTVEQPEEGVLDPGILIHMPAARSRRTITQTILYSVIPYLATSCITALFMVRSRWLWTLSAPIAVALVYCLAVGVYEHLTLPSYEEWERQLHFQRDPLDLLDVLGTVPAPSWYDVLVGCLIETIRAGIAGGIAFAVSVPVLRIRRIQMCISWVLRRLNGQ